MNDDRTLERAARSWLEAGPTDAPDHAVEAALLVIQTTHQERDVRVPWRARPVNSISRLAAVAAALVVVLVSGILLLHPGGNGIGSSSPSPSASPSQIAATSALPSAGGSTIPAASAAGAIVVPAMTQPFSSPRHGYSLRHPAAWTETPATRPWTGNDGPDPSAANMDILAGRDVKLYVESAPLGSQTATAWRDAYAARFGLDGVGVCDVLPRDQPRIMIGGTSGYLDGDDCPGDGSVVPGDRFFEALAFQGGRVYLFWIQGSVDRSYFDAILSTVQFQPSSASDKP